MAITPENIVRYYKGLTHQQNAIIQVAKTWTPAQWELFSREWYNAPVTPVPKTLVTAAQLQRVANEGAVQEFEPFVLSANECLTDFGITTPDRICHFLAQVYHESGALRYREEIASGEDYEWREDLGNIYEGDGVRFVGRGFIQITGRYNYEQISNDLGVDFVSSPELLATPEWAWHSAGWYWDNRNLNALADANDFDGITYAINGGYNGYEDRKRYYNNARKVFINV